MSLKPKHSRKQAPVSFESMVYWLGMAIVFVFLAWTVIMVLLQTFGRHSH